MIWNLHQILFKLFCIQMSIKKNIGRPKNHYHYIVKHHIKIYKFTLCNFKRPYVWESQIRLQNYLGFKVRVSDSYQCDVLSTSLSVPFNPLNLVPQTAMIRWFSSLSESLMFVRMHENGIMGQNPIANPNCAFYAKMRWFQGIDCHHFK